MKAEYDYLAAPLAAFRAGDLTRAIRMLEELAEVKPDIVETTYHLGRSWQAAGDNAKATVYYAAVIADTKHPYFAHARVRLSEMGVDPDAVRVTDSGSAGAGGFMPPHVVEATGSEVPSSSDAPSAPVEEGAPAEAAQVEAPAEAAPAEAAQVEAPAEAAPAEAPKAKGKKSKGQASADGSGQDGASS